MNEKLPKAQSQCVPAGTRGPKLRTTGSRSRTCSKEKHLARRRMGENIDLCAPANKATDLLNFVPSCAAPGKGQTATHGADDVGLVLVALRDFMVHHNLVPGSWEASPCEDLSALCLWKGCTSAECCF